MRATKTKTRTDRASGEESMVIVTFVAIKDHCYLVVNGHCHRVEGDVATQMLAPIHRLNAIQAAGCVGQAAGKATK